jgi:hypothetical protein
MKLELKMDWILLIIGLIAGAAGGAGITAGIMKNKEPRIIEKTIEVDRSLSNADLLKVPCSKEYIQDKGEALCREMFCRMNTRSGNQSNAASAKECELISNTINKSYVLEKCKELGKQDAVKEKACIEFFDRRL